MLYFSELYGKLIFSENKQIIGKLHDLLFYPTETPLISKFVINTSRNRTLIIPIEYIRKNGENFILKNDYIQNESNNKEISLLYKVQNQQITDIEGEKVIRVNDIVIADVPDYTLIGIDIGVLGVFRWIGTAQLISKLARKFGLHYKSEFIPYNEIESDQLAEGRIVLKETRERLKRIRPEDLAEHLEHATVRNVIKSLRVMNKEMSARVIADLNLDYQREIFHRFSPQHAGEVLSLVDADEAVDVLLSLDNEKRQEILGHIQHGKKGPIVHLLKHSKTPIGHLMNTEYITISADLTVRQALEKIRKETADFSELLYIYALNKENRLVGVISLHELITQKPDIVLFKIMNQNLILGRLTTTKEIMLRRMIKYNLYSIPIVDEDRNILGVVTLQNIAESVMEKE